MVLPLLKVVVVTPATKLQVHTKPNVGRTDLTISSNAEVRIFTEIIQYNVHMAELLL